MGVDKSKGSPYDLDPNSPHNMSREESRDWMKELMRRQSQGLPLDKPPGYYDKDLGKDTQARKDKKG